VAALYVWLRCHPRLLDGVLATALAFLGLIPTIAVGRYQLIPFVLLLCVPVAFRRAYPTGAFVTSVAVGAVQVVLDVRASTVDLAIVVLLYTLAAYRPRRISIPGLAICLAGSAVAVALWAPDGLSVLNWIMVGSIMFAGPALVAWVLGDSMRYRRAYYASLEDRAARLERERDAQAQAAAAAERARIARELHDVIAHNVSVMVVQADGASYALDDACRPGAGQARAAGPGTGRGVRLRDRPGPGGQRWLTGQPWRAAARRSDQPNAAITHSGSSHQAFSPPACTSSAVPASATATTAAPRQSSPTMKSYQNIPNERSQRLMIPPLR
jgi:hypothetical protein